MISTKVTLQSMCTIKIFRGGRGVVDGEGGSSEGCLKLKNSGWVNAKVVRGGEGFEGVPTPAPPPRKILIIHHGESNGMRENNSPKGWTEQK